LIYLVVYHVTNNLPLSRDEYENELTQAAEQAKILQASQPQEVIDANTLEYKADKDLIANGQKVFMSNNCGSCHRNDGGGNGIGPNLTDNYWIHGGLVKNIFTTIDKGVVEKGMPAWGKVMSPKDVRDVAFFVMSLQGTNPPDAKAPQGDLFKPETAPADTTQTVAPVN
ncbi:MAG: c-type cytochrome, partial [Bacteroidota bacterium]